MKAVPWKFDNSYARLPERFYTRLPPAKVLSPVLILFNEALSKELNLADEDLNSSKGARILSGVELVEGMDPIAQAYAGHQFGHFTILGDGRAHLLAEQINAHGLRFDLQLKGSGQTPYSRGGDGKAALGPMLREFLMSEAMYALNIPTTRSLAVVTTGEPVFRETTLPGAVLTRIASSHLRVGTFEYFAAKQDLEGLKLLADHAIERHDPDLVRTSDAYLLFFQRVARRQADLVSRWMLIGFVHGVMNTDNMTISGETLDFGPCAFMDRFDPNTVFSSIDHQGRYAYGNQPTIALWNLSRLAETLLPLVHPSDTAAAQKVLQEAIDEFPKVFRDFWHSGMRAKLGLTQNLDTDDVLIEELLSKMREHDLDYTQTFLDLEASLSTPIPAHPLGSWMEKWKQRLQIEQNAIDEVISAMNAANPRVIPRNHHVEEALQAWVQLGDRTKFDRLLKVLRNPYRILPETKDYQSAPDPQALPYVTFCGT